MTVEYAHLRRYGARKKQDEVETVEIRGDGLVSARGKLWNLRTGEAAKGFVKTFYPASDGRACAYDEGRLVVVHPDGRLVPLAFPEPPAALQAGAVFWVGRFVVARDVHRQPWIVLDGDSGAVVGRIGDQRQDAATGAYIPNVIDRRDGETLFFVDALGVQRLIVQEARLEDGFGPPDGVAFIAGALGDDDTFLLLERSAARRAQFDTSEDVLVLRDAKGAELGRYNAGRPPLQVNRLGSRFLVTDKTGFRVLGDGLRDLAFVALFDDDTFARTIPLPSGREWIAVGGHSEWDHYGERDLSPANVDPPAARAPSSKTTAKKPPTRGPRSKK